MDPEILAYGLDDALWDLITQAWSHEPESRPSAEALADALTEMATRDQVTMEEPISGAEESLLIDFDSEDPEHDTGSTFDGLQSLYDALEEHGVSPSAIKENKSFIQNLVREAMQPDEHPQDTTDLGETNDVMGAQFFGGWTPEIDSPTSPPPQYQSIGYPLQEGEPNTTLTLNNISAIRRPSSAVEKAVVPLEKVSVQWATVPSGSASSALPLYTNVCLTETTGRQAITTGTPASHSGRHIRAAK